MRAALLMASLLWSLAFCLAVRLEPRFRLLASPSGQSTDALALLLGDSRRLLARQMYAKADAYFHSGYYPSIFDHHSEELHLSSSPQGEAEHNEGGWLNGPQDWLDRFSRHFFPSEHRHLGGGHDEHAGEADHHDYAASDGHGGRESELLPWLRLSATLDPAQPQTYVVASYWLRTQLGKAREAERFLREGLRANPGHPELLFELGRIYRENHHDEERARNIWEMALKNWGRRSAEERDENPLLSAQLLGNLARLEEETGRYSQAVAYLRQLLEISPNQAPLKKWIQELEQKAATNRR